MPELTLARDLTSRWVACGARGSFATGAPDHQHEGGNRLPDQFAEEASSESDEVTLYHTEFVLEGLFQLSPHCESVSLALSLSAVRLKIGVKGIDPGLSAFGQW